MRTGSFRAKLRPQPGSRSRIHSGLGLEARLETSSGVQRLALPVFGVRAINDGGPVWNRAKLRAQWMSRGQGSAHAQVGVL